MLFQDQKTRVPDVQQTLLFGMFCESASSFFHSCALYIISVIHLF